MKLMKMKAVLRIITMFCLGLFVMTGASEVSAEDADSSVRDKIKKSEVMENRVEAANARYEKIFGAGEMAEEKTDGDFARRMKYFTYGEVEQQGNLSDKERALITLVVLETQGNKELFQKNINGALRIGVTPVEVKEALYQVAPYIGFPKVLDGLHIVNDVLQAKGVQLPLENQETVDENTRFDKGLAVQKEIFGDANIMGMYEKSSKEQLHIQQYLSAYCFGDTYTRKTLNLKMREMLTMAAIATLGGCEPQLKAHISANLTVGNSRETILSTLTECVPYIGFPRSLNAIRCMNEVFAAQVAGI